MPSSTDSTLLNALETLNALQRRQLLAYTAAAVRDGVTLPTDETTYWTAAVAAGYSTLSGRECDVIIAAGLGKLGGLKARNAATVYPTGVVALDASGTYVGDGATAGGKPKGPVMLCPLQADFDGLATPANTLLAYVLGNTTVGDRAIQTWMWDGTGWTQQS